MNIAHQLRSAALVATVGTLAAACATARSSTDDSAFSARKQLVRELVARGEWGNAFANASELHRQRPGDPEVLVLRGVIYRERSMPAEAEADLRAALAAGEDRAEPHAALAILLDSTGRSAEADGHHRRAVKLAPESAGYLNNLGFSLLVRRQTREALEVLQQAARLEPTNPRIRTNLGFAYAAAGDLPRASREFEMGGPAAEARNNLGFAYEKRGDLQNAFELYLAALKLDPGSRRARSNLVHVAGRLGRPIPPEAAEPEPKKTEQPEKDDKETP